MSPKSSSMTGWSLVEAQTLCFLTMVSNFQQVFTLLRFYLGTTKQATTAFVLADKRAAGKIYRNAHLATTTVHFWQLKELDHLCAAIDQCIQLPTPPFCRRNAFLVSTFSKPARTNHNWQPYSAGLRPRYSDTYRHPTAIYHATTAHYANESQWNIGTATSTLWAILWQKIQTFTRLLCWPNGLDQPGTINHTFCQPAKFHQI